MFFFFYNIQMNQKKYTNEYDGGNVFWYDKVYTERGFISYTLYMLLHLIKCISLIKTSNTTCLSLNKFWYFCKTRFIV